MANLKFMPIIITMLFLVITLAGCSRYAVQNPEQDAKDSSFTDLKEKGKMIVGTNLPFEPMEYYDASGKIVGFDIDLINEIASRLGLTAEIIDVPWEGLLDRTEAGEFDVSIDSITITSERMNSLLFSSPYLNAGQLIVVPKENKDIVKPEDLKGKKVVVLKGTTCEETALKYTAKELVTGYESQDIVTEKLNKKDADAMIVDFVVAIQVVKNNPSMKILEGQLTEEYYGLATKKSNIALMNEINRVLRDMKSDGSLKAIETKWLR